MNRRIKYVFRRLFLCILFLGILLPRFIVFSYAAGDIPAENASGEGKTELSVDPVGNSQGFSAVLYNNRNGLPTSDANAIAQTSEGFLWIGSYAGLIRYDGNTFERIDSTTGVANVRCLFVDSLDRLWIGTNDSGVILMEKGQFHKWDKADGLRSVSIRTITEDENGLIYIGGAAAGVATVDSRMTLHLVDDERINGQTVLGLYPGCDGLLYGYTQDGDTFTLKDGEVVMFLSQEDCRVKGVHTLLPDPARPGYVYIGTENSEVCYGSLADNFTSLREDSIAPLSIVNTLELHDGKIWICAGNGIGRLDEEGFYRLDNVPMNNSVENMMTDHEGNLWFVSSHQGVMKIVRNQFTDLFTQFGLPATVVNSTCLYGEELFFGTDIGLMVVDGEKRVTSLPLKKAVTASGKELQTDDLLEFLDGVRIRSIFRDSQGRIWIPTWRKYGLLRYDKGEVMAFSREDGLLSDAVRTVYECEDGSLLVANTGGVSIIQGDRVTVSYGEEKGILNGGILTVTEGFNHEIILGSDGDGIYVLGPDGTKRIGMEEGLWSEIILRIKKSDRGIYWIVTGNSLAYMTPDYQVTTIQQFPYPNNYDMYENSKGDVWILSSAGVYVVSGEELLANGPIDPVFYGMQSGLPYVASANATSELTAEGDLFIASSEGAVRVNIEAPVEDVKEVKVALPYVDADGERYYPDEEGQFFLPANAQKVTIFPYVFTFSMIDPQISYRLEGFDTADTTVSRNRLSSVDYTNLRNGSYQFVMTIRDTVWRNEQVISFHIVKGKELSDGVIGTLIMDFAALVLMAGILVYTNMYRKRGRVEDRLFFGILLSNAAMAVGELMSFLPEVFELPLSRELMIAGNTTAFIARVLFPYLILMYLDYLINSHKEFSQKKALLYGIPVFLFFLVMMINLKTGWIFSIKEGNVYHAGFLDETFFLPIWPVLLYFLLALVVVYKVDPRLTLLGILLLGIRLIGAIFFQDISSTSFTYALFLVCIQLYMMNQPLKEEAT